MNYSNEFWVLPKIFPKDSFSAETTEKSVREEEKETSSPRPQNNVDNNSKEPGSRFYLTSQDYAQAVGNELSEPL